MTPDDLKPRQSTADSAPAPCHDLRRRRELPASAQRGCSPLMVLFGVVSLLLFLWLPMVPFRRLPQPPGFIRLAASSTPTALECFQVAPPVLTPDVLSSRSPPGGKPTGPEYCSVLLMEHVFGQSYGAPFVGNYMPPNCNFNRVIMNFTVVSEGRQFDRLALMYFGDTEVWRTSTAEPTASPGIRWTYSKDMTHFLYLWKSPQKLIFDLGNLIDDKYTASFNVTLTATFFVAHVSTHATPPADMIIPISARRGEANGVSQFTLPADNASNTISFPRNVNRAVFSVSANGQASEEFWWSNVPEDDTLAFGRTAGQLPGLSPFREVQVLIDGALAGVQWPFPVVFTGGVVPSLHRPVVGLQAFDLKEHQIDITPWLPVLCDGAEHTFTIRVVGLRDIQNGTASTFTETVNDSWYVTGKIFLWLDEAGSITTGTAPVMKNHGPGILFSRYLTQNETGFSESLAFNMTIERVTYLKSSINTQSYKGEYSWSQMLQYSNEALVSNFGFTQVNNFSISGADVATSPTARWRTTTYQTFYKYPLYCNQTYSTSPEGNLSISAHLIEGLEVQIQGRSVFPTGLEAFQNVAGIPGNPYLSSHLKTLRDGIASFSRTGDGKTSSGYGSSGQYFHFGGSKDGRTLGFRNRTIDELYFRNVTAVNGTVVSDSERLAGEESYRFSKGEFNPQTQVSPGISDYVASKFTSSETP
ncbi:peptide-N4-(N-acetyl-beta-glucosaminyl)asparagine amidase A [Durotheca rogersii]|uniref:peptide-N4-(N-acetyl-beta- glucosaminyl)asparagine amidase A n=1 Tax=Durotheca rogersii TaxID=419775 RepID=UPI00221E6C5F|nr:peptide-N4-(N-acetyl-beta-glucosaminyl)asparagine amidase A [Durotheca rogersii]KAI5860787.1 peptide-N4-(N-acetyl-beta-glucosaminyl)asparagine amidase A [Durotheca rogersii]